jgi:Mg2+/Co2+ transporter CorB
VALVFYLSPMKYLLIILLFSSCSYSIHEANLIEQNKTMLRNDEQSRKKQQKIRDSRKKRVKNINMSKDRFFIN